MNELIQITEDGVDAKDLYDFLEIGGRFRDWIKTSIRDYGFEEGSDFSVFYRESKGGRRSKGYAISIDMGKELSMISKSKKGKDARKYFIKCEIIAKKAYASRMAGIEIRKTLTDKIKDSGENERMKGFAYSSYTKLAYMLCGLDYKNKKNFRDTLNDKELNKVKMAEDMIKNMLEMGEQYSDIKEKLSPIFIKKIANN